jgi:hypothetical protein
MGLTREIFVVDVVRPVKQPHGAASADPQARAPYGVAMLIVNDIVDSLNIANWPRWIFDIVEPGSCWLHLPTYPPQSIAISVGDRRA